MEWLQETMPWLVNREMIGYLGSTIILVSLLMTNVTRLRQINLVGSLFFSAYGWLIGSWPVCIINLVIAGIDLWQLVQLMRYSIFFDLAPSSSVGPAYLNRFFLFHERELMEYAPGLTYEDLLEVETCVLFRNMQPVGLFAFRRNGSDAEIVLDFMIAEYRDFKAGRFLYETKRMHFKEQGIKRFVAEARHRSQTKYYLKNNFVREKGRPDRFVREL